jgi:hypothetical protein
MKRLLPFLLFATLAHAGDFPLLVTNWQGAGPVVADGQGHQYVANGSAQFVNLNGPPSLRQFGAKENGSYATSGNQENLVGGTDDTAALTAWLASAKPTNATGSHYGGSALYMPFGISRLNGALVQNQHYTFINGDGYGASMIVAEVSGGNVNTAALTFLHSLTGNAFNDLESGGGVSNLSLWTDQTTPRSYGLCMDYCEYATFDNLWVGNFGKAGLLLGLFEGNFVGLKVYQCGASATSGGGTPTVGSTPDTGAITFDSLDSSNTLRTNANNTIFTRTTMSGCRGTWIDFNSYVGGSSGGTSTGLYFQGFLAESSPTVNGDPGGVEELPIFYVQHADLCGITNGQITMNSTGTTRQAPLIRMDDVGGNHLILSNFNVLMNPTNGVGVHVVQRLGYVGYLNGTTTDLTLDGVTIYDVSDSIGYSDTGGKQPLFIGTGNVHIRDFIVYTYAATPLSTGGVQRGTNIFSRNLTVNGDMTFVPYVATGAYNAYTTHYRFNNGAIVLLANALPTTNDQWVAGDRVEYGANGVSAAGYAGQMCVTAGNTGTLSGVTGTTTGAPTYTVTVSSAANLLPGDTVHLTGGITANVIASISGNVLTMVSQETSNLNSVTLQFVAPVWKGYSLIQS